MRRKTVLIIAGLIDILILQGQWKAHYSPSGENLNSVSFISSNVGWIVGDKGTILAKNRNGWDIIKPITDRNLYSVWALDSNNVWSAGANGTILHFDGKNWENIESPTGNDLYSISFNDNRNGVIVGEFGTLIRYKNGKWSLCDRKTLGNLYSASFSNNDVWIAGGMECVNTPIMKIDDNDKNSIMSSYSQYSTITGLASLNSGNVWAVGSPSVILHYNGEDWEKLNLDYKFPSLKSVFFLDEKTGISVGYGGIILTYSEGTWAIDKTPTETRLNDVKIVDNNYYAVGDSGTILIKTPAPANKQVKPEFEDLTTEIYPIPCDNILNIRFLSDIYYPEVNISLLNSSGQTILYRKIEIISGNPSFQLVTSDLKGGIYILKISQGNQTEAKKIVIAH